MLKRATAVLFILFFASSLFAQSGSYLLRPDGERIKLKEASNLQEAIKETIKERDGKKVAHHFHNDLFSTTAVGTLDTLDYVSKGGTWNTNFGFFGQDHMLMWFEAPAEMTIKGIGFSTSDDVGASAQISIRLINLEWTAEDFQALYNQGAPHLGYYPSEGDGFAGFGALPEEKTGEWVPMNELNTTTPWSEDFAEYDLWSDAGFGAPIVPELQVGAGNYQWVETSLLFEPTVQQGDMVGVLIKHNGVVLDTEPGGDQLRIGFFSDNTIGFPGLKYYENGRSAPDDGSNGWFLRDFTWDFTLAVDLIGDRAPVISNVTQLITTIDQGPQTVQATMTDDNPSGGPAGVGSAEIVYTVDDGSEQSVAMTEVGTDLYEGDIPGQSAGSVISYYVRATDVEGLESATTSTTYRIYEPNPAATTLVVVNGFSNEPRVLQLIPFYFDAIGVVQEEYDLWYFGPVSEELLNNYITVIELQMSEGSPSADNYDAYRTWIEQGDKNFLLAGQEALGWNYGFIDSTFTEGSFEYDILGVAQSYNDVSFAVSGDQFLPSEFFVQAGTLLGDSLATVIGSDSLRYAPVTILGDAAASNWLDQFDAKAGTEVFMHGLAVDGTERPTGHNLTLDNGSKVVFMTYDPLVVVSEGDVWIATDTRAPFHQAMYWFELNVVGVEDNGGALPRDYSLAQNYPNPFNPSTTIKYALPQANNVTVKVYDILGNEVATLIDGKQQVAGTYTLDFDASNLASGMYVYTVKAGEYFAAKKMMLLK